MKVKILAVTIIILTLLLSALGQEKPTNKPDSKSKIDTQNSKQDSKQNNKPNNKIDLEQVTVADKLIDATVEYQKSLEKLAELYRADITKAKELQEKREKLFADGIIAKKTLDESKEALKQAQNRLAQLDDQIKESDVLLSEAEAAKQLALNPPKQTESHYTSGLIRYSGATQWKIQDTVKLETFYQGKFHRALPISARGQTSVHDRLGFDHTNSIDVALSPESAEGQALMNFLRSNGIPFLAFSHAVTGAATGAHIHVGKPSSRLASN